MQCCKIKQNILPPVLMYHMFDPTINCSISMAPDLFEKQLSILRDCHFTGLTVDKLINHINEQAPIPDRSLLITFDDAYDDMLTIVLPLLEKYNFPGVFFVNTEAVGKSNDWNPKARYIKKHLDWSDLKYLSSCGHTIGSHSCSHRSFAKLNIQQIDNELRISKEIIEEKLNIEPKCFSYPYGDLTKDAIELVSMVYDLGFAVESYPSRPEDIRYRIPRISMTQKHTPDIFISAIELSLWSLVEFREKE